MTDQFVFLRNSGKNDKSRSEPSSVDQYIAARTGRLPGSGKLVFVLDATASRAPTWDMARGLSGDMIREAASIGRLQMQLAFFYGGLDTPSRCSMSDWISDPAQFAQIITKVKCEAGYTQISRALNHAKTETTREKVGAVVLMGDACEPVEDNIDRVSIAARELGQLKTPVFAFLEGFNPQAETGFRKIADLSGGAFGRFDAGGVKQLGGLLKAAAAFVAGGAQALEGRQDEASMLLLEQMRRNG